MEESNRQLLAKYPYLEGPDFFYGIKTGRLWTDDVPLGWRKRFFQLCDTINEIIHEAGADIKDFHVLQVKEKYGSLCFYWETINIPQEARDKIAKAIADCTRDTEKTCFLCGAPAEYVPTSGWICPYCRDCAQEWVDNFNSRSGNHDATIETDFRKIGENSYGFER